MFPDGLNDVKRILAGHRCHTAFGLKNSRQVTIGRNTIRPYRCPMVWAARSLERGAAGERGNLPGYRSLADAVCAHSHPVGGS